MRYRQTRHRVVITGMGAVTPSGVSVAELWNAVCSGKSSVKHLQGQGLDGHIGARVYPYLYRDTPDTDPCSAIAVMASEEALTDSGLPDEYRHETGVVMSSSKGGMLTLVASAEAVHSDRAGLLKPSFLHNFMPGNLCLEVARNLQLGGLCAGIVSSCATGTHSVIHAARMVSTGRLQYVLAGSSEVSICPLALASYESMGVLSHDRENPALAMKPFDKKRDGFSPGEGAGALFIESLESAIDRGAKIKAEISGWAYGCDTHGMTTLTPDGSVITRQIQSALEKAHITPADIRYINAHGTATKQNDRVEVRGMKTVFNRHQGVYVSSTKPVTGHLLGAAGSIETIITVLSITEGIVPATMNLDEPETSSGMLFVRGENIKAEIPVAMNLNYGFGGHIGVLILSRFP